MSWIDDTKYKLGYYPNKMVTLRELNIAPPDQVTFQAASQYYVRSDMSRIGDGFSIITWVWDTISIPRLSKILAFLGGKDSAELYVESDVRDGTYAIPKLAFKIYKATMWKPLLFGQEGSPIVKTSLVYQTVQLKFVNAVEKIGYLI
jgi:hypothetical protein